MTTVLPTNAQISDRRPRPRINLQRVETSTSPTADLTADFESVVRYLHAQGIRDDLTILECLQAAANEAEKEAKKTLRSSVTRTCYFHAFEYVMEMPWAPLQSVTSVKYYDPDDTLQTVANSNYNVLAPTDGIGVVNFDADFTFPNTNTDRIDPVEIIIVTGYGNADTIPALAKMAVRLFAKANYDMDPASQLLAMEKIRKLTNRGL